MNSGFRVQLCTWSRDNSLPIIISCRLQERFSIAVRLLSEEYLAHVTPSATVYLYGAQV
jgi:hypothetical protein